MKRTNGIALLALLATACTLLTGPSARALPNAPAEVANRSQLPSCGEESTMDGGAFNLPARRCFWDAYLEGRPAEFITTQPTIEGDPLTFVYRVLGQGQVEVFVDQTFDMSGPDPTSNWIRLDCRTLAIIEGQQGQPAFGPDDCDETSIS
jgi:hypothetical protein